MCHDIRGARSGAAPEKCGTSASVVWTHAGTAKSLRCVDNAFHFKAAVGDIFNDPIKGFGVLGSYTGRRMREATGYGIDRIVQELSPRLRRVAATYERHTVELSKSSDQLLRRYGKQAANQQHAQKRLADIAIDLFIGLCVLSRAHSLAQQSHTAASEAISIAEIFTRQARRRVACNVRSLERSEDVAIEQLAGAVLAHGGYMWDVIQA